MWLPDSRYENPALFNGATRPTGRVKLDRNNKYFKRLYSARLFDGQIRDLLNGTSDDDLLGDYRAEGLYTDANTRISLANRIYPESAACTVIAGVTLNATDEMCFCYESDGASNKYNGYGSSAIIREIHLGVRGTHADWTHQSGNVGGGDVEGTTVLEADTPYVFAGVCTGGAGTNKLYVNGILDGSGVKGSNTEKTANNIYLNNVGELSRADRFLDGTLQFMWVFMDALTDAQVNDLSGSPYQMLIPV